MESCLEDGAGWGSPVSCNGKGCASDACNGCVPNEKQCAGTKRKVCLPSGTWAAAVDCPNGCTAGDCRECPTDGATRCVMATATLQTCKLGFWGPTRTCLAGCNAAGTDCVVDQSLYMFGSGKWTHAATSAVARARCPLPHGQARPPRVRVRERAGVPRGQRRGRVRDMPGNFGVPTTVPVKRPDGTVIDSSFPALLDGNVMSAVDPSVPTVPAFWSGSAQDGSLLYTCAGWTSSNDGDSGTEGLLGKTASWLFPNSFTCKVPLQLACLCW
jgi:hypothetical protein